MNNNGKRAYFQQRQRNRLYEGIVRALETAAERDCLKRKDIADRIGKSEQSLSRMLSGPSNWGIDTVSDLLFAIDAELDFEIVPFADRKKSNEYHPLGEPRLKDATIAAAKASTIQANRVAVPNLRPVPHNSPLNS